MSSRIGVIGLGKLGLPIASIFGQYHSVIGLDTNSEYIEALKVRNYVTPEPDVNLSPMHYTTDYAKLVDQADIIFVCVNTPMLANKTMDFSQLTSVGANLYKVMAENPRPRTIVILSTLMPHMGKEFEKLVGNRNTTTILTMPVWIAMGSVVKDFKNPPSVVIGSLTKTFTPSVVELLSLLTSTNINFSSSSVIVTTYETAALIKLAHNAWCTTKMSFMGELALLEGYQTSAIETFFRNGGERPGAFWKVGPPFGGPCFPRDLYFFNSVTKSKIGQTAEEINNNRLVGIAQQVPPYSRVVIWGETYKYGVPTREASIATSLAKLLVANQCDVYTVDDLLDPQGTYDIMDDVDIHIVTQEEYLDRVPDNKPILDLWSPE